ncbi:MAG: hypothetical protein R6U11_09860 [Bacteroidales bacterium]
MKPLKNISGLALWLMRLSLVLTFFILFFNEFLAFKLSTPEFYLATAFLIFGLILLIGGFFNSKMTVVASLILLILSAYKAFAVFDGLSGDFACWVMIAAICSYFLTHGNK